MSACEQEMCPNWDGHGCPCDLLDIPKPDRMCSHCLTPISSTDDDPCEPCWNDWLDYKDQQRDDDEGDDDA